MTRVDVDVRTWNVGGENPDDPWSRDSSDGEVTGARLVTDDYHYSYRGMETDLEPPFYVVYAGYYTGDTFGSDYTGCVVGVVKTEEEANDLKVEAENYTGYGELSNGHYVDWNGYFESLDRIGIERIA